MIRNRKSVCPEINVDKCFKWMCGLNRCHPLILLKAVRVKLGPTRTKFDACYTLLPYPARSRYVAICLCSAHLGHGAALSVLRRSARLEAHPALRPPLSPPQPALKPHNRGREDNSSTSFIVTEPRRSQPDFSPPTLASLTDQSRSCVPLIRQKAPRLLAPFRSLPGRSDRFPPGEQFIPWKLDELLDSCEQVREESWGSGSASTLRPGKPRLSRSCGR